MTPLRPHRVTCEARADGTLELRSDWPLGPVAARATDWLERWAAETPGALFLAERSGAGWRELRYAEALDLVRALAGGLAARGLGPGRSVMIVSGNSVDHALLSLAAQWIGAPVVPTAEQYALLPGARGRLDRIARLIRPALVYADDAQRYGAALALDGFGEAERLTDLGGLLADAGDPAGLHAAVGPDTVAKILLTSGSTGAPKGVLTTQRMMCTNQAQLLAALPFLADRPPRMVDWLPWNHVFGGSHNFNLALANGGTLWIDGGKPVPGMVETTLENLRAVPATLSFNVPAGYALLRDAMAADAGLRRAFFEDLDMIFYAGASLSADVWADLEAMGREVRGEPPLITSSWGMTETAPCCLIQHEGPGGAGIVGVPVAGVTVRLVPEEDGRAEIRVRGPSVTPGYHDDPEATAAAFDEEGFLRTGDAVRFLDPGRPERGLRFEGRIAEDFKLSTGTWVRAAALRLDLLAALRGLAADVVVTGADRAEVGVLILPSPRLRAGAGEAGGALVVEAAAEIAGRLRAAGAGRGSASRAVRALVLSEPASLAEGEITAKGNLNYRRLLSRRATLLERLYDDGDPAVILT